MLGTSDTQLGPGNRKLKPRKAKRRIGQAHVVASLEALEHGCVPVAPASTTEPPSKPPHLHITDVSKQMSRPLVMIPAILARNLITIAKLSSGLYRH